MPVRIIGLDISATSVKAVLLTRGFRKAGEVLAFRRVDAVEAGGIAEALLLLFSDRSFADAICVTSLPSSLFSFRNIQLPFHDERKIRQTAAFALEPLLQQPLDAALIDYVVIERGKQSKLFAAIVERGHLEDRRVLVKPYVRETAVVDIDAVPLASFLSRKPDSPPCSLLLDVGCKDTTAVLFGKDCLFHIRHFYFGGQKATEAPAGNHVQSFLAEMKNTVIFLRQKGQIPEMPAKIFLTGGGSRKPGLADGLAGLFGVSVAAVDLLSAGGFAMDEKLRASWDSAVMDQALALAARPLGKGTGFNFLQREQEARADSEEIRGILKKSAIAGTVALLLAGVELGLGDYAMRLQLARLKKEVVSEFKKIDPEATKIVDPVVQIRGKIAESKKLTAGIGEALSSSSALDILRDISSAAQPELSLASLSLEEDVVALKGVSPNFDAMDAFKKKLEASKYVKTVSVGATSLLKEGKGVEFNLKVTRKK